MSTFLRALLPLSLLALSSPALARVYDPTLANANADVQATKTVTLPAAQLYERLLDLHNVEAALDCTRKWEYGQRGKGVGASASMVYKVKSFRRKLTMTLSKADENRKVTFDHPGNKGFVTVWTLEETDRGTKVDVHTYLNMPPWPVRKLYLNKIQPEWAACQERAIDRISKELGG